MMSIDERISAAEAALRSVRKERAFEKVNNYNEIQKLQTDHQAVSKSASDFMAGLVQRKKQPASNLNVYRNAISEAFGDEIIPAFCLAKQAFLLRSMHSMICCDSTLKRLKKNTLTDAKVCESTIRQLQEETTSVSIQYMNLLIEVQHEIKFYGNEMEASLERIEYFQEVVNRSGPEEESMLDDVPLEDAGALTPKRKAEFGVPKRSVSLDQTADTVSLSYADGSSVGEDELQHFDESSLPRYIN